MDSHTYNKILLADCTDLGGGLQPQVGDHLSVLYLQLIIFAETLPDLFTLRNLLPLIIKIRLLGRSSPIPDQMAVKRS